MIKVILLVQIIFFLSAKLVFADITLTSRNDSEKIPIALDEALKKEGCVIPTKTAEWVDYPIKYYVSGEFAHSGQKDNAVICHKMNKTYIKLIWGGQYKCDSEIESYGEAIDVVDKEYIQEHYEAYGGTTPPEITHHGINDIILEKASIVRYCHNGEWIELTGAD